MGVPLGIGAGIYLSEYGRNRFGDLVRFVSDVLNGVPSIVIGIVAYGLVVLRQRHFSALAGGVALAIMMVPTIAAYDRADAAAGAQAMREAAYGLGIPQWRDDTFHHFADGDLRNNYGSHVGFCSRCRRDGTTFVYSFWKSVLELEVGSADRGIVVTDF